MHILKAFKTLVFWGDPKGAACFPPPPHEHIPDVPSAGADHPPPKLVSQKHQQLHLMLSVWELPYPHSPLGGDPHSLCWTWRHCPVMHWSAMRGDQMEGRGCPLLDTLGTACCVSLALHCQEQAAILLEVLWQQRGSCGF